MMEENWEEDTIESATKRDEVPATDKGNVKITGFLPRRPMFHKNDSNTNYKPRFSNRNDDVDNNDEGSRKFNNRDRGDNGGRRSYIKYDHNNNESEGGRFNRNRNGDERVFGNRNRGGENSQGSARVFGNRNRDGDYKDVSERRFGNQNGSGNRTDGENGTFKRFNRNDDENKDDEDDDKKPLNRFNRIKSESRSRGDNIDGGSNPERFTSDEKPREDYRPEELPATEEALFHEAKIGIHFDKLTTIECHISGSNAQSIKPIKAFGDVEFSDLLKSNIAKSNYKVPTPVQRYSIPAILARRDLMACACTGSGKTAGFVLPIMANIIKDGIQSAALSEIQTPQALVLSPTRELAIQTYNECRKFGYGSIIQTQILYGGTNTGYQLKNLSRGANILVATPGRLIDILNKGKLSLEKLKYLVLDEADRMLDMGFLSDVRSIMEKCTLAKEQQQILLFSATFPDDIQKLAQDFLRNYLFLAVGTVGGANLDVEQALFEVERFKKKEKLVEILNEIGDERAMVFINSKRQADVIGFYLIDKGFPTTTIHGDRLQKQREEALNEFKIGKSKVIICTSVAARGLDINDVKYVINFDLPTTIDEYVHRIGRTGRCGNVGKAISFFDPEHTDDAKLARSLVKILIDAQQKVPQWLSEIAENATGQAFTANQVTNDLRDDFKSKLSLNERKRSQDKDAVDEESW